MSPGATAWLTDVFLVVNVTQINKMRQATQTILVRRINSLLVLVFSWDYFIIRKI